jgi:hypothetical protein
MQILDPLFTIPLYYDSPRVFREKLQKKFEKEIKDMHPKSFENEKDEIGFLESRKSDFSSRYPSIHRYNNILGYAELAVEPRNIVIYFYLNGNKRKAYNKTSTRDRKSKAINHSLHIIHGELNNTTNTEIRKAIEDNLAKLAELCGKWQVFVNTERELRLIQHIDFEKIMHS